MLQKPSAATGEKPTEDNEISSMPSDQTRDKPSTQPVSKQVETSDPYRIHPGTTDDADPTGIDELASDGSASAFEGTESIDSKELDRQLQRKQDMLRNDPSGRSNY